MAKNQSEFDTDIIAVYQDSGKKAIAPRGADPTRTLSLASWLDRLGKDRVFIGNPGSIGFLRSPGKKSFESTLFLGLGTAADLTEEKLRLAGGSAWSKLKAENCKSAVVHLDTIFEGKGLRSSLDRARLARAFAEGLVLGAYDFDKYKSKSDLEAAKGQRGRRGSDSAGSSGPSHFAFLAQERNLKSQLDKDLLQVRAAADSIRVTRDWSNEPSNFGTPEYFASEARKLARRYGLKCKILSERDAAREKMGLFLGVGQGSEREGKVVILEYVPTGVKSPKTLAWIGKGVTFDSGGISIKPSARMEEMKHDMTGAATLMGAILLASEWKVPNRVIAILCFTENMPDGKAIQPGNVLTSRSGKTVEIINTDAEGRLILADALDLANDFRPDAMIDVATLTGAVSIALGKHCCAILGNDEALIDSVKRAGELNGERIWQLPLYDEYFDDMKSDCADMKNAVNDSYGGTIRGAIFLKQFVKKGIPWAHLDIAATAYNLNHLPYYPKKGASGAYVRTLAQFAADF